MEKRKIVSLVKRPWNRACSNTLALVRSGTAAPIVGRVNVIQNYASNTAAAVSVALSPVTTGQNFNVVTTPGTTRGDFALSFGANSSDDLAGGVLIASAPGGPARHDYAYERNGTANLFVFVEPLRS